MLLEAGGEVRFETRPIEGLEDKIPKGRAPVGYSFLCSS